MLNQAFKYQITGNRPDLGPYTRYVKERPCFQETHPGEFSGERPHDNLLSNGLLKAEQADRERAWQSRRGKCCGNRKRFRSSLFQLFLRQLLMQL